MVSPHHFILCCHSFERGHLLRMHSDSSYHSFPLTYSPTYNSCNVTWDMMNHVDVEHGGSPWLSHNYRSCWIIRTNPIISFIFIWKGIMTIRGREDISIIWTRLLDPQEYASNLEISWRVLGVTFFEWSLTSLRIMPLTFTLYSWFLQLEWTWATYIHP